MVGFALEISHLGVDALVVRTHQPAGGIPVVAVDLGQHAVGAAQVVRPRRRQARAPGQGLDHHGRADLAGFDPAPGLGKLGLEPPHETHLENDAGALRRRRHGVALRHGQGHGLLAEHVLAGTGGEHGQIGMGKGGSGYDDPVESGSRQCLVEVGENRYAELSAGLVGHLRVGVHQTAELDLRDGPGGVASVHHARSAGTDHG